MAGTEAPKPASEDDEVADWDRLCEHHPPPDAYRWRPDDKEKEK